MSGRTESRTTSDKVVIRWKPEELRFDFNPAPVKTPVGARSTSALQGSTQVVAPKAPGSVKDAIIRWLEEHV